jgi:AraC-like DNA-binding protein
MQTETVPHLNYLGLQLIKPSPLLQLYVQSYWVIHRDAMLAHAYEEFLHPSGGFGIIFNLGDDLAFDGVTVQQKYLLDGTNTVSRLLRFQGTVNAIGVRFYPGGAYPFLQIPMYELADEMVLLDDLALRLVNDLYHQVGETVTLTEKIGLIEDWLLRRLFKTQQNLSQMIPKAITIIRRLPEDESLKTVAADLHISQRQFERLFKTQVGFTPKQYARLLRIDKARAKLKQASNLSSATIGAELGFYDQSHFIREFRAVVGMTPHDYLQRSIRRAKLSIGS